MRVRNARKKAHPRVKFLRMGGASLRYPAVPCHVADHLARSPINQCFLGARLRLFVCREKNIALKIFQRGYF